MVTVIFILLAVYGLALVYLCIEHDKHMKEHKREYEELTRELERADEIFAKTELNEIKKDGQRYIM